MIIAYNLKLKIVTIMKWADNEPSKLTRQATAILSQTLNVISRSTSKVLKPQEQGAVSISETKFNELCSKFAVLGRATKDSMPCKKEKKRKIKHVGNW